MDIVLKSQLDSSWREADQLISILRQRGINYLLGEHLSVRSSDSQTDQQPTVLLVQRLALCVYPRVRDASISLFLLHPELAPSILEALRTSEEEVAGRIATLALATLYLQRFWSWRLTMALGHAPAFPESPFALLWQKRHFPPPACHYGTWGLAALQQAEQQRSGLPLNYIGDWQNQVEHLLLQEEAHHRVAVISTWCLPEDEACKEEDSMSMRPNVDKERIENFLKTLGRTFHKSGRLYLVGGAALVHLGIRLGTTRDIDVEVRAVDEDELVETIRRLKDTMKINVKFASPADFMPLPKQWEMHARYIGRYGMVDVFYFDFHSIALSKIQRGSDRDINDVRLLLQHGIITLHELDIAYGEVLPQVGKRPYNRLDPKQFAERYAAVHQLLE